LGHYKYEDEKGKYRFTSTPGPDGKRVMKKIYLGEGSSMTDVWSDIDVLTGQNLQKTGYVTQKNDKLLERIIKASSNEGDLVADFFAGSGTTLAVAEKLNRRWLGCELGKVGIQVTRGRLVEQKSKPFLIENIGNYQREMIYLGGARIYEMQKIILKLYGAEPMANRKDLGVRKTDDGLELVYCGYPDRAVAAHKVEDLAMEAQMLDGAGYKRLVILAWDYEYNYDELLQTRIKAAGKDIKTEIVSRQIPPDIYEYLKQAKSEEDIERLSDKVKFLEKPYLRLRKAEVKGNLVTIGIEKYVLYDFPLGSGKKADEDREALLHLVKDNFAILIDYWAVDWDYDGMTFKSMWQDLRGLGRKTKVVTTEKEHTYEKSGKHTIAVRVVDIFGNDATATINIKA
jgi:adenine-specific DNA-methyltransferase